MNIPSEPVSLRDRYNAFIDQIIAQTLKGEIRSKEQVYQYLVEQLESGAIEHSSFWGFFVPKIL